MHKLFYTAFFTALIFLFCFESSFAEQNETRTITVVGNGEIKASPDIAYINISIVTTSPKADEALKENADKTTNVLNKIKSIIGKDDTVKTSSYSLSPVYQYDKATRKSNLTGYTATNELIVETRDLDKLGNLIDETTGMGANRINGPRFDITDRENYKRKALRVAIGDAKTTAKVVADAAGVELVQIIQITPSYTYPVPVHRGMMESKVMAADQAATPIEPGDLTVTANVTISYEIR